MILRNNQAAIDVIRAAGPSKSTLTPDNGYIGAQVWTIISDIHMNMYVDYNNSASHAHCGHGMSHCLMPHGMEFNTKWLQLLKPRIKS
ncbi:hypothetical protein KC333_g3860 [Hortaea werneckii]|nr:hypothetical protein KC333_g3860 [Hortaea werneckii]KAI7317676.1 hypothetical protein KC326_g3916 [Hortaea werneckii]